MASRSLIRNFCIIAHIDHGKSTLADRLLESAGAVSQRDMRDQVLDTMDLERERGITIKAQAVRLDYEPSDGRSYVLNLIDTPGHVDFSYEVSRSLAACEGAVLLVDANQGVQAQTVANAYLAVEAGLEIIPVVNKIDLPSAEPERAAEELARVVGGDPADTIFISAKTGEGVDELTERIVEVIPPPAGDEDLPLSALIFDSYYDLYRGVVCYVRVMEGSISAGERVMFMATGEKRDAAEIGVLTPGSVPVETLVAGEVGYLITGAKEIDRVRVGDTVTSAYRPAAVPLRGYTDPRPMVFAGIFPTDGDEYPRLREALEKLRLNDASLQIAPEFSQALGFGFRCGFLGLLHMEIVRERLEREYSLDLVTTSPSVAYRVTLPGDEPVEVRSPADFPAAGREMVVEEPWIKALVLVPPEHLGAVMEILTSRRGELGPLNYLGTERVELTCRLPLAEVVFDFYDRLKSKTRGFASLDYEPDGYQSSDLVKVDLLLNGSAVDAFSAVVHRPQAYTYGREMVARLKGLIPRQLFDVPIQAAIGSRVISRETIRAKRKDVLAKCYGGDVTRKKKLLARQKEGKRRMKMVGSVEVPSEAFVAALRVRD